MLVGLHADELCQKLQNELFRRRRQFAPIDMDQAAASPSACAAHQDNLDPATLPETRVLCGSSITGGAHAQQAATQGIEDQPATKEIAEVAAKKTDPLSQNKSEGKAKVWGLYDS